MNKDYDKKFHQEIERILNELYHKPIDMGGTKIKRAIIQTEKRHINYLINYNLVSNLNSVTGGGKWGIQLESNGYEVFEKYNGWNDYKRSVIDSKSKIENAKNLSARYWWIPICISLLSLLIAIIALFKK